MKTLYIELGSIMGTLEAEEAALETILLNGKNEKANRYIKNALNELRACLSDLSDADFELATSPDEG